MVSVVYEQTVNKIGEQCDNTSPIISVVINFNRFNISIPPEILSESYKWSELVEAVKNNTEHCFCSKSTNSKFTIKYSNNMLEISMVEYSSKSTSKTTTETEMTEKIKQALIKLEIISKIIENKKACGQLS
jgi:hypothetical protein